MPTMMSFTQRFTQHRVTEASITRNDSRKGLLDSDSATQDEIDEKSIPGTDSKLMEDKATQVNDSAENVQKIWSFLSAAKASVKNHKPDSGNAGRCLARLPWNDQPATVSNHQCPKGETSTGVLDGKKTNCLLEQDVWAKGGPLPQKLACAFCKCTHHQIGIMWDMGLSAWKRKEPIQKLDIVGFTCQRDSATFQGFETLNKRIGLDPWDDLVNLYQNTHLVPLVLLRPRN